MSQPENYLPVLGLPATETSMDNTGCQPTRFRGLPRDRHEVAGDITEADQDPFPAKTWPCWTLSFLSFRYRRHGIPYLALHGVG
jgi:hypothetical protein